jgi:hypothetical protein
MNKDTITAAYALGILHGIATVKSTGSYSTAAKQSIWNQLFHESRDLFSELGVSDEEEEDGEELDMEEEPSHASS